MSENYDAVVIFPIYGQFGAMQKPDSGHIIYWTCMFINSKLLSYKNWKQNKKISNTALTLLLWLNALFLPKNADFLKKDADITKIKRAMVLKDIFSQITYVPALMCQFWSS